MHRETRSAYRCDAWVRRYFRMSLNYPIDNGLVPSLGELAHSGRGRPDAHAAWIVRSEALPLLRPPVLRKLRSALFPLAGPLL